MKENKTKKENKIPNKNKKLKVISIILILLLIILGVVSFAYSQNIKLAKNNNEEQEVEESKTQEIILEDNKYMHVETDASGDQVPVPNGFVGSKATGENEIDTGFVIYEGEEEVTDSNAQTAQTSRNQYVWIPVEDISKFYGTDANGKSWGKNYNYTTGTNSSSTFDEVTGTYAYNWSETNGVMSITRTSGSNSYREPDVLRSYDTPYYLRRYGVSEDSMLDFLLRQQTDFKKMIYSVEKYGGFYIGRYETGDLNQEVAVVQKGNTNIASQTWYAMYEKCKTLSDNNNNIETGMIWGNQWDRTMMWLIECNAKDETTGKSKEEVISDSTSWGNYSNATFTYTNSSGSTATKNSGISTRIPTGSTEYTKANNIYDLAGNVYDWTMEARSTDRRVSRGGGCNVYGTSYPARIRYNVYPYNSDNIVRLQGCTVRQVKIASVTCDTSNFHNQGSWNGLCCKVKS